MVKVFQLQQPKLLYLSPLTRPIRIRKGVTRKICLDQVDRLPPVLKVSYFDLFCFLFSMTTYFLDVVTDLAVVYIHFHFARYFAASLILSLTIVPTVLLNAVSLLWSKDDITLAREGARGWHSSKISRILCVVAHIFQLGPMVWYIRAIYSGIEFRHTAAEKRERHEFYCEMVVADRDASLLRFFEAFIESLPQLLVQGYMFLGFYNELREDQRLLFTAYLQILSLICSLISSCWSISVLHRNLRIARPDKENMDLIETCLQFLWRLFTISARYECLVVFAVAFHRWLFVVIIIHLFISSLHIAALQLTRIDGGGGSTNVIRFGLVVICAIVHIFAPFNMAEGPTKWRYICGYTIEVLESAVLFTLVSFSKTLRPNLKVIGISYNGVAFVIGILFMLLYYEKFHPKNRPVEAPVVKQDSVTRDLLESCEASLRHVDSDDTIDM